MARYCEANDLRALVPDVYRDAALADSFGGANADPGMLDLVLSSACDEVDALISGRVRLPLPPDAIPSKLRTAAALFAAETLCIRRGAIMPEALAAKVKWWRDWLSKIGEGDLRLAASAESDDEAGKSSAYMPAAITARPAITGSHGLLGALALLLCLGAGIARGAVGHRTFSLAAPPDPATFTAVPSIEWERGESVSLDLSGAVLAAGQFPSWQVADASNLWMDVASATLSFHADPATAAIPPGRYMGRVVVTNADSSLVRVLAVQNVRVLPGAPDLCPPEPASTLATTAWVESLAAALSNALHEAAAAIQENVDSLDGRVDAIEGHFLPAERDDETEDESYVVEAGTTFQDPVTANGYRFGSGVVGPVLPTPSSSITNNILGRFASRARAYANGIILNSAESFLRMTLGDFGGLVFRKEITSPKATATLKAGDVSVEGETITLKAEVYDEDEDETTPGPITLDGNVAVKGDFSAPGIRAFAGEGEGVATLKGHGSELNFDEGFFRRMDGGFTSTLADPGGTFRLYSTNRPEWNGQALATTDDLETGGPLFPRYFSVDGLRTNRVWAYLPSGPETTLGGAIRAVPLNREYVGVLDTAGATATSLIELPDGETPHFADTGTMAWSTGDPFGYGSGTATGFWWRAAGPCTGSWAVAGAGFTNLWSFPPKEGGGSPAWGWTADAAGSLRERSNADLDAFASRAGRTAEAWAGPGGSWTRNTNFWAAEVDLSCSVQVYWDGTKRVNGRATAVTRRHVVSAHHYRMPEGSVLYFYPGDGTRVERTVTAWAKIGSSDVAVGLLDEDLPEEIEPARIVRPEDWALLLPPADAPIVGPDGQTGAGKTAVRGPKLDALSVHSLYTRMVWLDPNAGSSGNLNVYTNNASPYSNFATRWGEAAYVTGDSGTPVVLWLDGQTVLALCLWHGNVPHFGDGPSVSVQSAAIEAQIRAWGGTTETNLYWADLSRWSSGGEEDGGEEGEEESP